MLLFFFQCHPTILARRAVIAIRIQRLQAGNLAASSCYLAAGPSLSGAVCMLICNITVNQPPARAYMFALVF